VIGVLLGTIWSPQVPALVIALVVIGPVMVAVATVARRVQLTRDIQLFR
jgi:hypothetical protein